MTGVDLFFDWSEPETVELSSVVLSEWDGGATVSVIVNNTGSEAIDDWALRWQSADRITYYWDAQISVVGDVVTALPGDDRAIIEAGQAVAFGFNIETGPQGWIDPEFDFGWLQSDGPSDSPPTDPETPDDGSADGVESARLGIEIQRTASWDGGYSANVVISNPTLEDMTIANVRWALPPGVTVDFIWNATYEMQGDTAIAEPDEAFRLVKAGEAISFGFNVSHAPGVSADFDPVVYVVGSETPPVPVDQVDPVDPAPTGDDGLSFNPIIGTQTIGPGYTFSDANGLVETARAIRDTGSNILKIALDPTLYGMSSLYQWQPVSLLTHNEAFRQVLDMDFDHYFFWLERSGPWVDNNGISPQEYDHEYTATYDLARYLLETFRGTGKSFYIGNWETDWNLLEWNPTVEDVDDLRVQGLIDWLNLRQAAIDQAERDVDADGVELYHYLEVNRVDDAQELGLERVVNQVLPHVDVDLVSYSAYDVLLDEANIGRYEQALGENLDYIESLLRPKEGIPFEKRVFVGEFGFYLKYVTPEQQFDLTLDALKASVAWGTPFSLVWQMYDTSAEEGLYLIGPDGQPTELHAALSTYNESMRLWHGLFVATQGREPTEPEIRAQALVVLDTLSA